MRLPRAVLASAAAAAVALTTTAAKVDDPAGRATATPGRVVVAISVDGLNPTAVARLGRRGTPALHRMLRQGAGTLNARSEREQTRTLPNHTGMLTGRPVDGPHGHHVTFNEDNGGILPAVAGGYVAGIFDVVHDHGMSTAFLASKDKFDFLDRSWDRAHGAADATGPDDGRDKIDRYVVDTEADNVGRLVRRLERRPAAFTFLHLAEPDAAGHAEGFLSPAYLRAVTAADAQVGRVLDAIAADPDLRARTTVLLTADHGGKGAGHDDPAVRADYRVPFLAWGAGVARGADLYDLNAGTRADPGRGRPTYTGTQPVRNADVANLVARLLGLPPVPGSTLGTPPLDLDRS